MSTALWSTTHGQAPVDVCGCSRGDAEEVRRFLTHLASEREVAAATQNQALNTLVFLYREVVGG